MIEIPFQMLKKTTLNALIEEYVTRDGTDYGETELSILEKSAQVIEQIKTGETVIVFDEESQSHNIVAQNTII